MVHNKRRSCGRYLDFRHCDGLGKFSENFDQVQGWKFASKVVGDLLGENEIEVGHQDVLVGFAKRKDDDRLAPVDQVGSQLEDVRISDVGL